MDLARMLEKCRRDQWRVDDVDVSAPPRPMSREEEEAAVQYFTNMAGIERLAGALFAQQARKTKDPVLKDVFATFVDDEVRHAQVAQRLADRFDVHHYRVYQPDPHLVAFTPCFVDLVQKLSAEVANIYVTTGEILLDVALLRSIADKVDDDVVRAAMRLVDRDEARHIAVDFHMISHYASEAYQRELADEPPVAFRERVDAWVAMARVLRHARPFFRNVFFAPMDVCDPSGRRVREAFKRLQLLATKPEVARRPFTRFLLGLQAVHNDAVLGPFLGRLAVRVLGVDSHALRRMYTDEEAERARAASYDTLADETLALKGASLAANG